MSVGDSEIGFLVTHSRTIKSLARKRASILGIPYTLALRHIKDVVQPSFVFGDESKGEYWDMSHPHLLMSSVEQVEMYLDTLAAIRREHAGGSQEMGDAPPFARPAVRIWDTNFHERQSGTDARLMSFEISVAKVKHKEDAPPSAIVYVVSDLAAVEDSDPEHLETLLSKMEDAQAIGVVFIAMTSRLLGTESRLAGFFRKVGDGVVDIASDDKRKEIRDRLVVRKLTPSLEFAMPYYTDKVAARIPDLTDATMLDRFLRIARARYSEEHGGYPVW